METAIDLCAIVSNRRDAHPDTHLYLLLDHAGLPKLMGMLKQCAMQWCSLFDETRESAALAVAPILVVVGSPRERLTGIFLEWIVQHGAYASAVTLLDSPIEIADLRRRLVARLDITLTEDMAAVLRFFDPRILAQLRTTLTPEQALAFFSVASRWWYIDRAGVLMTFDAQFTADDGAGIPLVLDQSQEFALVDASEVDQVLSMLNEEVPNLMRDMAPPERYSFVVEQISLAKREGLESLIELVIYVATAITARQDASATLLN